jgi:hypothetical protein
MAANMFGSLAGTASMGRYFTVVSALPSLIFVVYTYLLFSSGAWHGPVRFDEALRQLDLGTGAVLTVVSFTAAVALHPLQFALIQLLEGYWGTSRLGETLALARIRHHRRMHRTLDMAERQAADDHRRASGSPAEPAASDNAISAALRRREARRLQDGYPDNPEDILPTRLGNALRRYEMGGGKPFGLELVPVVPRISMISGENELRYVTGQRTLLELTVRVTVLGMLATAVTVAVMWRHGGWLLLALAPYAVAYLAYRGAVTVAHEYGTALIVMIELNRFTLYERFHLKPPDSLREEQELNTRFMALLQTNLPPRDVGYTHPPLPTQAVVTPVQPAGDGENG